MSSIVIEKPLPEIRFLGGLNPFGEFNDVIRENEDKAIEGMRLFATDKDTVEQQYMQFSARIGPFADNSLWAYRSCMTKPENIADW